MASDLNKPTPDGDSTVDSGAKQGPHLPWIAGAVTAGALLLLVLKLWMQTQYPSLKLDDPLSAGLLLVAVLPWVSHLLARAKLPGGWEFVFRDIKANQEKQNVLLRRQQEQIQALRTAVRGIVTEFEHDKLLGLIREEPFMVMYSDDMFDELKRLRALTYIRHHDKTGLARMQGDHKEKQELFDLKQYFFITDEGRNYVMIRGKGS
jgi:hypothetical protein